MTTSHEALVFRTAIKNNIAGSIRFFGEWFGQPWDNIHSPIRLRAKNEIFIVDFDQGEILTLWAPDGATLDVTGLYIEKAHRLRWEWSYDLSDHGREPYVLEYSHDDSGMRVVDTYESRTARYLDSKARAFELVTTPPFDLA